MSGDGGGPIATISQPVVQAIPGGDSLTLNSALSRLAQNPRDVDALIDAGNAALKMGDFDAAGGFYRRADQISPGNPRARAGLAGALVRSGNPFDAIPLFQQAEKAGATDGVLAADRGLAYDLVGDNDAAQRYYRQALARGQDAEVIRRLALSQAIAGDKRGAEATLTPLLRLQDKAAWRTRAFALAAGGDVDQAISITKTILPPDLAAAIVPYLRYMPRLTRAQQASAANFGVFPRASDIGQDDPRVALYASTPSRPVLASADTALTPKGEPLGNRARGKERTARDIRVVRRTRTPIAKADEPVRVAPPEVLPAIEASGAQSASAATNAVAAAAPAVPRVAAQVPAATARPSVAGPSVELPPVPATTVAQPAPPAVATVAASPGLPAATASPAAGVTAAAPSMAGPVEPSDTPLPTATVPMPGFDLPVPSTAANAAPVSAPSPRQVSLADAFREFAGPGDVAPVAGAVDMRRITPSRPKPATAEDRKPAPPSHPSRIWVQMATGRDKAALAFDWRRMSRQNSEILKGKDAFVSDWGQTNRLLTGPFASNSAANAFLAQLRRAGIDGPFLWTSPAGQVVDAIAR